MDDVGATIHLSNITIYVEVTKVHHNERLNSDRIYKWIEKIQEDDIIVNYEYSQPIESKIDLSPQISYSYFLTDQYKDTYTKEIKRASFSIEINSINFLPAKLFKNWEIDFIVPEVEIPLVPQKQNVELSGTINVNENNSPVNDKQLDVFTANQIAKQLNLSEKEIFDLINSGKLKAKKIGSQYLIRKEDFDTFLKN